MKELVIVGAGNFGRELFWHAQESVGYNDTYKIKGFIDDVYNPTLEKYKRIPAPWIGKISEYQILENDVFICAIGDSQGRKLIIENLIKRGAQFINLIHKTAVIQGQVKIGRGVFIGPFTAIGDSTVIGDHVMLNTGSAVGHDVVIGNNVCIMSHVDITGWSVIEDDAYLASSVSMTPGSRIGAGAYVGIGSVVLKKVKAGTKVFGNPAKEI